MLWSWCRLWPDDGGRPAADRAFKDLEELGRLSCGASISRIAERLFVDSPIRRVAGIAIIGVAKGLELSLPMNGIDASVVPLVCGHLLNQSFGLKLRTLLAASGRM